ncbi:kinase-like domain-containing protein [Xylaria grammica]|nr:kinase-like domain-containing protein [Xylaria grammica]
MKVIENGDTAAKLEIAHPFIAPLEFSFRTPDRLSLLSPMASCGYLFSHPQKKRRFDANSSRLCAAELICVLECLHDCGITFPCLRPEDILVNAFGHISICRPDLFALDPQKRGHIIAGTPETAAPELLLGKQHSMTMDWWSLGAFLYEMLTGLLPFYDKDPEKQRYRILNQNPTFEGLTSSDAAGILMRLLEKDPTKRLGVNGVSEVKAHAFFKDIDWDRLPRQTCVAYFEPCNTNMEFRRLDLSGRRGKTLIQRRASGIIYREDNPDGYVEHKVLLTPLEWAVEHGNIDLVNLFLDKSADASYTIEVRRGPSLVKAVRKGDQRLVDILAKRTDRVSLTRALRLAVELRDTTMAKMMLSVGACCDFERADGASPEPVSYVCCFGPGAGELQT